MASEGGIYFSEIMWNGSLASSSDEWVELYNDGAQIVNLEGYSLYDGVKDETILTIEVGQIAPKGYFLISNNSEDHSFTKGQSILNVIPDIVDPSLSLSNSNFQIKLLDKDGNKVDVAGDGGKPFFYDYKKSSIFRKVFDRLAGDKDSSWGVYQQEGDPNSFCTQRENLDDLAVECATPNQSGRPKINRLVLSKTKFKKGDPVVFEIDSDIYDFFSDLESLVVEDSEGKSWNFSAKTKKINLGKFSKNSTLKLIFVDKTGLFDESLFEIAFYQDSKDVFISEVMPHPYDFDYNQDGLKDSDDEYFEIVNASLDTINLDSWSIADASGKRFYFSNTELEFGQYAVFFKNESNISINDSGDVLTLYNGEDEKVDEVSILSSSSKKNLSYSKWADLWYWSQIPTPKSENIIMQAGKLSDISQEEAQKSLGLQVVLSARVVEVERSSFAVELPYGRVDVANTNNDVVQNGDTLAVEGRIENTKPLFITACKISIQSSSEISPQSGGASQDSDPTNDYILETKVEKRTTTTRRSKKLASAVLGSSSKMPSQSLKNALFMLQLSGILSFVLVVMLYEIYGKERE